MSFAESDVEALLARTARMCAICKYRHRVQVHHIVPVQQGGSNDITNAIPLCPNCHDEVHSTYVSGRTTRQYTAPELRQHLKETISLAARQASLTPGNADWQADADRIRFYAQCLDRPAFRTHFHEELSFADLDRALEDTALAINTGYWRTRDGAVLDSSDGKIHVINPAWRDKLDRIVEAIENARGDLRRALYLDRELMRQPDYRGWLDRFDPDLRANRSLGSRLDAHRQRTIALMNEMLAELGIPPLQGIELEVGWTEPPPP